MLMVIPLLLDPQPATTFPFFANPGSGEEEPWGAGRRGRGGINGGGGAAPAGGGARWRGEDGGGGHKVEGEGDVGGARVCTPFVGRPPHGPMGFPPWALRLPLGPFGSPWPTRPDPPLGPAGQRPRPKLRKNR